MNFQVYNYFRDAIRSLASSDHLLVWAGGVRASLEGRHEASASFREVHFEERSPFEGPGVALRNSRYVLYISHSWEATPPSIWKWFPFVPCEWAGYGPLAGYWWSAAIPTNLLEPLLQEVQELGLAFEPPSGPVARISTLLPLRAGYHGGQPVYRLASQALLQKVSPLAREEEIAGLRDLWVEGNEPRFSQGNLELVLTGPRWRYWYELPEWRPGERLFNHSLGEGDRPAQCVAIRGEEGGILALTVLKLKYAGTVTSPHSDLTVGRGMYFAIHPWPEEEGGVD